MGRKNKSLIERPTDRDLPKLPRQIRNHFPHATIEEQRHLASLYTGKKENPSFTEWLESYQQNQLFTRVRQASYWVDKFGKDMKEKEEELQQLKQEELLSEEGEKKKRQEIKNLHKMVDRLTEQYLALTRELDKLIQNNLMRDTPRKSENVNVQVTPGDVANLINNAKNTINTTNGRREQ